MTREELQPKTPIQCTLTMNFEEMFKSWTLEQKVEWALGPNICNLSNQMRSIIVDLESENKRLDRELKHTELQDQVVIDGLREENERLKARNKYLENFRNEEKEIFTPSKIKIIKDLKKENERLKAELKKWEDRSKVVKDGYDGEVYEWENNYYIVTPRLNVFVKGLLKENAKLKCLALHAMAEYCFAQGTIIHTKLEFTEQPIEEDRKMIHKVNIRDRWGEYFVEAYRKAKKALKEGK